MPPKKTNNTSYTRPRLVTGDRRSRRLAGHAPGKFVRKWSRTAPTVDNAGTVSSVFRLLDLPPECRIRIYSYAVQDGADGSDGSRNLHNFLEPPITVVSKQVRQEALPVLFADCTWNMVVGTNHMYDIRELTSEKTAGTYSAKREIRAYLRESGDAVVLRHVVLQVYHQGLAQLVRQGKKTIRSQRPLACVILDMHPRLSFNITHLDAWVYRQQRDRGAMFDKTLAIKAEDFTVALQSAQAVAEEISSRVDIKGLTMTDLKEVAAQLRWHS